MKEAFAICFEIPGWSPQRKRGTLSSEEKQYLIFFYFMKRLKSVVGSLTLLDRNCRMVKRGSLKCISVHITKINNIISSLLERLPNLTTKQKKHSMGPSLRKKCDNKILESWTSCTTPTRPSGFHPPKACSEVISFSSTTCRFATAPKHCFYLGFQDFLFDIILTIGLYPAWLPNNFSKNQSHLMWNKGDGSRVRVVWTFIFRSRAWGV